MKKPKAEGEGTKLSKYFWPAISAVLAVLLLASVFSGSRPVSQNPKALDTNEFSLKMKGFIQSSLLSAPAEVSIQNITEENGLYRFSVLLNGKLAGTSYATKDGTLLFPQSIDVEKIIQERAAAAEKANEPLVPPKSDVPKVQLFVMSQCPYGIQAENAMKPVLDALSGKISFELKFIANENADGTFSSLHGQAEVDEDKRQACAMNVYLNYMDYVICRNANINNDWQSCATRNGMNVEVIRACSEGKEGDGLLSSNIKLGNEIGVSSSPTILINSKQYPGQRTPDAFLGAICSAFNNPPANCSQQLGTNQTVVDEAPHEGCGA